MRVIPAVVAALIFTCPPAAWGQDWIDFVSREDGFRVNFPGQPKVEAATFRSEYGADLPARVYRVDVGGARYSMMVVNYATIEQLLTARSKQCPPFADERCTGVGAGATVGFGYWRTDVRAALVWASWQFIQRDAKVTHYMWNFVDLVEGHQLQLTNRADQSRTFASIYMHDNRLYIMEGTVPDGEPEPGLFQQSLGFVDKDGNGVRYRDYYDNDYPAPARVGAPAAAPVSSPQPGGGAR